MRKTVFLATILAGVILTTIVSCNDTNVKATAGTISNDSLVKRGNYLVNIAGCDDCHSPKRMGPQGPEIDMEQRLSGYPASRPFPKYDSNMVKKGIAMFNEDLTSGAGPWGISFAANLTSDPSGLGDWNEARFFKAMREGKFKGLDANRSILPPMPWQNLKRMTDDDLKAIFAFLKSTKPVSNIVPGNKQFADLK
ncbi:MAG: c-type cytochrome [Ferruginibacter sp.]